MALKRETLSILLSGDIFTRPRKFWKQVSCVVLYRYVKRPNILKVVLISRGFWGGTRGCLIRSAPSPPPPTHPFPFPPLPVSSPISPLKVSFVRGKKGAGQRTSNFARNQRTQAYSHPCVEEKRSHNFYVTISLKICRSL